MDENLIIAIEAAVAGGKEIIEIYDREDFQVENKIDDSPLTIADKRANDIINNFLRSTGIPIISEENKQLEYRERKSWEECWIVDPLDGTKEFIKRNGEFTVNIALVKKGEPVMGVIYVPATKILYFGSLAEGKSYRVQLEDVKDVSKQLERAETISPKPGEGKLRVVGSRSHMNDFTLDFIEKLKRETKKEVELVSKGSSLKFCLLAEGLADIYPRFAPTMEWDTAAGQAICKAVGLRVIDQSTGQEINYNRKNLLNNFFLVSNFG